MSVHARKSALKVAVSAIAFLALALLVASPAFFRLTRQIGVPVTPATAVANATPIDGGNALRYAKALQQNDCSEAVRLTAWMSDRLRRVAAESSDPKHVEEIRSTLCRKLLYRPYEDNVLRKEGIDDQFVFAPGTELEVIGKDQGRQDLSEPVAERVWIRVTYPKRDTAPLAPVTEDGPDMKPVHQWIVGVNLSRDSQAVVKASIQGNLEYQKGSAIFEWPER